MAHKFVLLIISLCASSLRVRGQLPDLSMLQLDSKPTKTTTTPPPEPDPILTGAARTSSGRVAQNSPSDIVFNDGKTGGSATDTGTVEQVINLDLERLITETLGGIGDPGAPRQTDMTSLLDLINTDPISSSPSQNEPPKLPDFFSLQQASQQNSPASGSNTDSSVGIPMSLQESSRAAASQKKSAPTVNIPENPTPPELPSFSDLPPLPNPPDLPPLSAQTNAMDASSSSGLPPLSQTPDLPPLSQTPELPSLTETQNLPPLSETPQLPPQNPQSPPSRLPFPNLPTSGRQPLDQRAGLPPFNPQSPFARRPSQGFQGLPRGPFAPNLPSGSDPLGLGPMGRRRNPLQAASQLLGRVNNRGPNVPSTGPENIPSGPINTNAVSEGNAPSNDQNLLPFAENVLTQVQQLVDRLKDNGDGRPAGRRNNQRRPGPTPDCPNGRPACPENSCETSACLNIINAQCRPSCTGCAPRYFVNDRDVTETCTIISGLRPSGGIANIDPREQGAHLFMGTNGEFLNIPNRGRPPQPRVGPRLPTQRTQTLIDPLTRQPMDPRFIEQLESRRMRDPRMEQLFSGDLPGHQFVPGAGNPNMDPRFLRALIENENQARLNNRPNGTPFDPRIRQFMRPGSPPINLQQIARAQGQNLDMDAVRRFIAERGLQGTVNLGEPDSTSPARSRFGNRINEFRRRAMANRFPTQGLPNGINTLPTQGRAPGNSAVQQRPLMVVNQQDLQRLQTDFAAFQARPGNTPQQTTGNRVPNTPNLQTAQNNPLGTIAAFRQLQRQATFRAGRPSPGRQISNVI
ncbi:PML-RARA-regulated adapter molecule 1-like [Saccostrea echinata]|uniref:PML-RARA-regulated adapter molecule 1-like n=1 Tax=Saccostrea echinata TaxID=191078 RepID=UPI002A83169D|nr:PML-RARA-regulated adapter molecule 1-like [Saccostrea echinata]